MARTSKSRGAGGFKMRSGNASPYKFLGGVGKFLKKAVNSTPMGMGINALTGNTSAPTFGNVGENLMGGSGAVPPAAAAGIQQSIAGAGTAMMKKNKSPMKAADAILVSGAYDAASAHGTKAMGQIAEARALGDMVNSVEETVNRSSKAQNVKDRRRQKVQDRSHHKYGKFRERKGDEWYDESADHMHTPPHGF